MNTLQELNNYGSAEFEFTDNRPAGVIFDKKLPLAPTDDVRTISTSSVVPTPGINILEIINYQTANVRYRVNIQTGDSPALVGSSISWGSLPSGVTLSTVGNTYTLSGIKTLAHWEAVKLFTWNLPANRESSPLWFLEVAILFYDEELDQERTVDWLVYDPRFYYVGKFYAETAMTTIGADARLFNVAMQSRFYWIYTQSASLVSTFTVSADVEDLDLASGLLRSEFTQVVDFSRFRGITKTLSSTVQMQTNNIIAKTINNMTNRSYQGEVANSIFATSTPFIEDLDAEPAEYEISFSSPDGEFGLSTENTFSYATLTLTGTKEELNDIFADIIFYPDSGLVSNTTFNFVQRKNGSLLNDKTLNLTFAGIGTIPTTLYSFTTTGLTSWSPKVDEKKYSIMDFLIVGAGAGGGDGGIGSNPYGGGGGAGEVLYYQDQSISQTSYTVRVGSGGNGATPTSSMTDGQDGGFSQFGLITADGGLKGKGDGQGGASGSGNLGKAQSSGSPANVTLGQQGYYCGGSGGGDSTDAQDNFVYDSGGGSLIWSSGLPGSGTINGITGTNITYGIGGRGGYAATGGLNEANSTKGSGGYGSAWTSNAGPGLPGAVYVKTHG